MFYANSIRNICLLGHCGSGFVYNVLNAVSRYC